MPKCAVCGVKVEFRRFVYGDVLFCSKKHMHIGSHVPIWTRAIDHAHNDFQLAFAEWMLERGWERRGNEEMDEALCVSGERNATHVSTMDPVADNRT